MVLICEQGIVNRLANSRPFYLVTDVWERDGHGGVQKDILVWTTIREARADYEMNKGDKDNVISTQLLKVIPGEQRWEILEAYERGE